MIPPRAWAVALGRSGRRVFEEADETRYGCHEPGHYRGGLVGKVTVED